ncbi:MAG: hypothetical protein AABN95_07445 [Acidobacteriota bacterium]
MGQVSKTPGGDAVAQDTFLNKSVNQLKSNQAMRRMIDRVPRGFKSKFRRVLDRATIRKPKEQALNELGALNTLLSQLIYEQTLAAPRTNEPRRLLKHGFKVYSQHDEDGIIEEVFKRIGSTNRFFVEFGVGDGLENCTLYCLLKNWHGVWIDGSATCVEAIENEFKFLTESGRLKVRYAFTTAENIEQHFQELGVPEKFDLLSIDIDNNDYWVWKAIQRYSPRVVAIEYNASFKQTVNCVIPYNPARIWNYTNYFGASLKALEELGREKGYCLVGCNYTGVTAFFVRQDLVDDHFAEPFSAENHYEAPRYYVRMPNGHPAGFGPTVSEAVES